MVSRSISARVRSPGSPNELLEAAGAGAAGACIEDTLGIGLASAIEPTLAVLMLDARSGVALGVGREAMSQGSISDAAIVLATKKDRGHVSLLRADASLDTVGVVDAESLLDHDVRCIVADQHLPESFRAFAESRGIAIRGIGLDARALLRAAQGIPPIDPLHLGPVYAREPDAVTQWRARGSG